MTHAEHKWLHDVVVNMFALQSLDRMGHNPVYT